MTLVEAKQKYFKDSTFTGPYEKVGSLLGMAEEQWLWKYREHIKGDVLDMSTPKHWHEFLYAQASKVFISDLSSGIVEKMGHISKVDIIHDFCYAYSRQEFDTIISSSVLEHCENPFQMVKALAGCLKQGGYLFLWTPFAYMDGHMNPDRWRFCHGGYSILLKRAGLTETFYNRYVETGEGVYQAHGIGAMKE